MIEASDAKVMPRVEILYTTIQLMLRLLIKEGLRKIIPATMKHYLDDDDKNSSLNFLKAMLKESRPPTSDDSETPC